MQSTENVRKWKFDLLKFWFVIKYFITNFFSLHCVHFYLTFCFHDQRLDLIAYTSLCTKHVIKIFQTKNMKT